MSWPYAFAALAHGLATTHSHADLLRMLREQRGQPWRPAPFHDRMTRIELAEALTIFVGPRP